MISGENWPRLPALSSPASVGSAINEANNSLCVWGIMADWPRRESLLKLRGFARTASASIRARLSFQSAVLEWTCCHLIKGVAELPGFVARLRLTRAE